MRDRSLRQALSNSITNSKSLSAFAYPAFRWYFGGQLISVSGTWMQAVAQQIVVYQMTGSDLALGLVACAQGLPALILTPFGGVLVERFSRRKLLIVAQSAMMVLAFIMAFLQFTNSLQIWHIVALSVALGVAQALDSPARQTFVIEMVGRENLSSGIAMNSIMFNGARIFGPALGGFALKTVGASWCFLLNGISFLAVILSLVVMVVPVAKRLPGRIKIFGPIKEGVQFARHHHSIGPLLMLSTVVSVFGITYAVLIPPFADKVLHDTELGTSALLAAQGLGAVLASIMVAKINSGGHRGRVLMIGGLIAPICVILFALNRSVPMAIFLTGAGNFAFTSTYVLMNTLIQTEVPDDYRGRILSLYSLTFFGLTPFASLIIGMIAESTDTIPAILLYGVLCLIGVAFIAWRAPVLRKLA